MPAAAKQKTEAGLKAFGKYWLDALGYAYQTGIHSDVLASTAPECTDCLNILSKARSRIPNGGWPSGGAIAVAFVVVPSFYPDTTGVYLFTAAFKQASYIVYTREGKVVRKVAADAENLLFNFAAKFQGGSWKVQNLDKVS